MISNFEKALKKNELPEYFRGAGPYFTRDPDWGTQLHIINWQGLCSFLEMQKNPETLLKDAFSKYVNTIDHTTEDASDLLENIGCYYYMRNKASTLSANNFDLIRDLPSKERKLISEAMKFLKHELNKSNNTQDVENYKLSIKKLVEDGGPKDIENL